MTWLATQRSIRFKSRPGALGPRVPIVCGRASPYGLRDRTPQEPGFYAALDLRPRISACSTKRGLSPMLSRLVLRMVFNRGSCKSGLEIITIRASTGGWPHLKARGTRGDVRTSRSRDCNAIRRHAGPFSGSPSNPIHCPKTPQDRVRTRNLPYLIARELRPVNRPAAQSWLVR